MTVHKEKEDLAIGMGSLKETTTGTGMDKEHKDLEEEPKSEYRGDPKDIIKSEFIGIDTEATKKLPANFTMGYDKGVKPTSVCLEDGREFAVGDRVCSTLNSGGCVKYAKIEEISSGTARARISVPYDGKLSILEDEDLSNWMRKPYLDSKALLDPGREGVPADEVEVGDRISDGTPECSGTVIAKYEDKDGRTRLFIECDRQGWMSMVRVVPPYKHIPLGFNIGDKVICVNYRLQHEHGCSGTGIIRHIFRNKHDNTIRILVEFGSNQIAIFGPPDLSYATGGWDTLKKVE